MRSTIFIVFSFFYTFLFAQQDTILVGYSPEDFSGSTITEMTPLGSGKIGFAKQVYTKKYQAFVTDLKGNILHQAELNGADGYDIITCAYMFDDHDRYVFIGSAKKDNQSFFISFAFDTTLQNLQVIDAVQLGNDEVLTFEVVKFNLYKNRWESFGALRRSDTNGWPVKANCYIALDNAFYFLQYQPIYGQYLNDHILEFYWNEPIQRYYLSSFNLRAILLDADLNILESEGGIRYKYTYNNINGTVLYKVLNCLEQTNGQPLCYATLLFDNDPYKIAFIRLDIQSDTILVNEVIPVNSPPINAGVASQMRKDSAGNLVISGNNGLTFGSAPNQINVAKFSPTTFERLWTFTFENGYAYTIWDMEIDQNNDIIIVGSANLTGDGINRGFLLKLLSNGTLSSYEEQPLDHPDSDVWLYPNPVTTEICFKTLSETLRQVHIWDTKGSLIQRQELGHQTSNCVQIPHDLPQGMYIAEILLQDGYTVVRKFVVE